MSLERAPSVAATEATSRLSLLNVVTKSGPENLGQLAERGIVIRAEMNLRRQGVNWGGLGKPIFHPGNEKVVLAIHIDPERTKDFRALLQCAKTEMPKGGNNVLLRVLEGYSGCNLYTSQDGMAGLGSTPEGTIISVFKAGPRTPRAEASNPDEPQPVQRHRLPDLIRVVVHHGGGHHLACLAHLVPLYAKFGFDVTGVVPLPPKITTPGWNEKDDEDFAAEMEVWQINNEKGETVKLPLAIMRLNPERFAEFDASDNNRAKIVQPMDPSVFEGQMRYSAAVDGYAAEHAFHQAMQADKNKAVGT